MKLTNDSLRDEIRRELDRRGITVYQAAKELGTSRQTIHNYLNETTDGINSVTLTGLMRLCGFVILSSEEAGNVKSTLS